MPAGGRSNDGGADEAPSKCVVEIPPQSAPAEDGYVRFINRVLQFLKRLEPFLKFLESLIHCFQCSDCLSNSGLFQCAPCPIFQPFLCARVWMERRCFGLAAAAPLFLFQCAWQCVQFWTPLTLTVVVLWLLYRPDRFHPRVDSAVLAALDVGANALRYDLAVDLSFRNSHSRLTVRYLDVGATAFYNGTKLGPADNSLPSFHQPPKNTTVLHPAFQGVVVVESGVAAELERERAAGTVHVRVSVDLTLMYKVWFEKEVFFYKYDCWLWFPPPRSAAPAVFHGDGAQCWRV